MNYNRSENTNDSQVLSINQNHVDENRQVLKMGKEI